MPLEYRGYSVHISCNGKELPQYQVELVNETTIACYIPSEAGQEFRVVWKQQDGEPAFTGTGVEVYADGRRLTGFGTPDREGVASTAPTSIANVRRYLTFSQVKLLSDGDAADQCVDLTQLGVIDVRIYQAVQLPGLYPHKTRVIADVAGVSERSKMIGINQVSYGREKLMEGSLINHRKFQQGPLLVSFQFRHRPAAMLQAIGIMPRADPAPERIPAKTPPEPSNAAQSASSIDLKNLFTYRDLRNQATLRSVQDELKSLKSGTGNQQSAKRERSASPIRVGAAHGEVIDLTSD
ncbi:hypothetical protein FA95DRAFT_1566406 [Auriscalpium vulgare]|uniref:Uncharacterized protein n=1 Tax=Auriscalpium vulgare TaxID=40419 RepID=A0ACB8RA01_9AGAM|nr:hypothetical protein FA95DRAFT_1566406 [Auriscalpium vulgare]